MITLTPSQEVERKQLLFSLEKDLKKFQYELNHKKLEKIKSKINKHIKISICKGKVVAPFALALGITLGGSIIFGATPFYIDKEKSNLKVMEEISSTGSIRYEQQYVPFENINKSPANKPFFSLYSLLCPTHSALFLYFLSNSSEVIFLSA